MKNITLENGRTIAISDESYQAFIDGENYKEELYKNGRWIESDLIYLKDNFDSYVEIKGDSFDDYNRTYKYFAPMRYQNTSSYIRRIKNDKNN